MDGPNSKSEILEDATSGIKIWKRETDRERREIWIWEYGSVSIGKIPVFVQGNVFVGGGAGGEPEKFLKLRMCERSQKPLSQSNRLSS
jgi:hypothetical protein